MRRLINLFKEPIYKKELIRVILYAVLATFLIGILCGIGDALVGEIIGWIFLIFLVPTMIAKILRKGFYETHIWFRVIFIVAVILAPYIYNIADTFVVCMLRSSGIDTFKLVFRYIIEWTYSPKYIFTQENMFFDIIGVVFYIISIVYGLRIMKN